MKINFINKKEKKNGDRRDQAQFTKRIYLKEYISTRKREKNIGKMIRIFSFLSTIQSISTLQNSKTLIDYENNKNNNILSNNWTPSHRKDTTATIIYSLKQTESNKVKKKFEEITKISLWIPHHDQSLTLINR